MKLPRRQFLHLAASAATVPVVPRVAMAQAYPARPVRIIVGFSPGGSTDLVTRIMGQWLEERLGQPIIVENRPGAGGSLATQTVVNAQPDGYTLVFIPTASVINATLNERLPFNFLKDIAPLTGLVQTPNLMAVIPSVPANNVAEFITYAKTNPGKINMASPGFGTLTHLAGELFNVMAGVNLVQIHYRGAAPMAADIISGQVHGTFDIVPNWIEHVKAGRLRALAVTTATRIAELPDVPTVSETVSGYEASTWWGLGAPKDTPRAVIEKLNHEINAGLANPSVKARLGELGFTPFVLTASEFGAFLAAETEKWRKVIRVANIKAE